MEIEITDLKFHKFAIIVKRYYSMLYFYNILIFIYVNSNYI